VQSVGKLSPYRLFLVAVAAVALVGLAACTSGTAADAHALEDVDVRPLEERDGPTVTLADLTEGRPTVVNFFASWCVPCIEEMPDFESVHRDVQDEVTFIGLAYQDGDTAALGIVEATGVTYPTYIDIDGQAMVTFEGTNMPTTVFLEADGTVAEVRSRPLSENALRDAIDEHFGA
jgi:thiol-disulfide isomerase/thioredoxin